MGPKYASVLLFLTSALAVAQNSSPQNTAQSPAQRGPKHICTDLSREEIVPCPGEAASSANASASSEKDVPRPTEKPAETSSSAPAAAQASPSIRSETVTAKRDSKDSESRAEAPPDANRSPVPNDYPVSHAAVRELPLNLLQDQRNFFTSPLRTHASDLDLLVPFAGVTAVLAGGVDRGIESHLPTSPSVISRSKTISDYGAAAMGAGVAGAWLLGEVRHDDHMTEAGFLSGEAAVSTLAIAELGKYAFGRQRPLVGNGKGDFFSGGDSFPSLHAAAAFSIATVMSEEYPSPYITFLSYGAATGIAAARVTARQHFASDVLVGAGLGWFMGRQVYRAHHNNDGDLKRWGTFERGSSDQPSSSTIGSPNVPLDSWVYPAFDRLEAMGYISTGFLGLRPWTRSECARLIEEAQEHAESMENNSLDSYLRALEAEFASELGGSTHQVAVESLYARYTSISDEPLTDGYHFGQTIVNDYGRPYEQGNNAVAGLSARASAGPFAFYFRGEFQYAPSAPALPLSARQAIYVADFTYGPVPPALAKAQVSRFQPIEAYAAINLQDWQISFGSQALWWGPDASGPMIFSDNAQPLPMLRISRVTPIKLPGIFSLLGELRVESFLGRLQGQQLIYSVNTGLVGQYGTPLSDQPFISGQKLSFKFTPNFELGFSRTVLMGGNGVPFTSHTFLHGLLGSGLGNVATSYPGLSSGTGDQRSGLDFAYRIPRLRNWLTFYADGFTDDQFSPIAYWDRSAWTSGLYLSHVPYLPKLDARAEGVFTDLPIGGAVDHGFFYFNDRFLSGYTSNGVLLGSWIGRQSQGARVWSTYHFSPRSSLQFEFGHQKTSAQFIPGGGTITDASVRGDFLIHDSFTVSGLLQYERWNFPVLAGTHLPFVSSIQLTYWPRALSK